MAASHGSYRDDSGALRYGHGGQSYINTEYGARQAAEARLHASSGALPYLRPASASTLHPEDHRDREGVHPPRGRPRSLPPLERRQSRRFQERSPSTSSRESNDPIRWARGILKETFSNSASGLGAGVLGAVVGGLVAREASEASAASRSHSRRRSHHDAERARLISTVLGAAVGGLGANAIEKRIQVAREKMADKEEAWERRWHRDSKGRRDYRDEDEFEEDGGRRRSQRRHREMNAR